MRAAAAARAGFRAGAGPAPCGAGLGPCALKRAFARAPVRAPALLCERSLMRSHTQRGLGGCTRVCARVCVPARACACACASLSLPPAVRARIARTVSPPAPHCGARWLGQHVFMHVVAQISASNFMQIRGPPLPRAPVAAPRAGARSPRTCNALFVHRASLYTLLKPAVCALSPPPQRARARP